jgi:hypothetical protein
MCLSSRLDVVLYESDRSLLDVMNQVVLHFQTEDILWIYGSLQKP